MALTHAQRKKATARLDSLRILAFAMVLGREDVRRANAIKSGPKPGDDKGSIFVVGSLSAHTQWWVAVRRPRSQSSNVLKSHIEDLVDVDKQEYDSHYA